MFKYWSGPTFLHKFTAFFFLCLLFLNYIEAKEQRRRPDEVLEKLINGNERYRNDQAVCPDRFGERRASLANKQKPFAVIVGCADSRVAPEIIFDQGIGDLFVVRVAGNVVGPFELDSIEYAINHLHASLIIVLGHENCGAIETVLSGKGSDIEFVAQEIKKNIKKHTNISLEQAIKRNALAVVGQLESNPQFFRLILDNKLKIMGGYYHFSNGEVELLKDN
jgi:carbonic anhydrase